MIVDEKEAILGGSCPLGTGNPTGGGPKGAPSNTTGRLAGNPGNPTGRFRDHPALWKRSRRGSAFVGDAPTCEARYPSFCSGALVPCKKSVLISSMASMERVKDIRSVVESFIRARTIDNSHRAEL